MHLVYLNETASFDVDAQKGFTILTGELPVPDGENIVEELNTQGYFAKYRVGSKDAHPYGAYYFTNNEWEVLTPVIGSSRKENMDVYWPPHCIVGTEGFDLLDGLPHPIDYDFFVYKGLEEDVHPYGACYHDMGETKSTGVIEFLKSKNVKNVIVGGLATDYCVKTTALQLKKVGFNVFVNLAASRGVAPETTRAAIEEMEAADINVVEGLNNINIVG